MSIDDVASLRKRIVDLTFGLLLHGLYGAVQLSLIVGSRHVQPNTQRLRECTFYFIQLCPDACLQDEQ